ncbi:hypothetical protein EMA8858_00366 [Emticicia aquatica]|jgi:uncharacterized membrane protein|uniref:Cytochrome c domain-containing protein n=1 Tax=Emticicia aquatica TaxID=1681835 RepID=A0ABN8EN19_9BACT|nr:c-type cytochrome domain-containing protein [Emticicia aquatica]CAH0994257.1 hypothetical protein EMA8858_00366 [Emticicia aquatica]
MKRIQKIILVFSVFIFILSACLDSKNNAPSPISSAEVKTGTIVNTDPTTTNTGGTSTTATNVTGAIFTNEIMPLLKRECLACHQAPTNSGGINLETYTQVKKYVDNGKLYGSISGAKGFSKMPPSGTLTNADIAKVKTWIDAGATNDTPIITPPVVVTPPVVSPPIVTPSGSSITIDCPNGSVRIATNAIATGESQEGSKNNTSSSATATVCFDTQVLPFFQSSCAFSGCHNSQSKKEGYDLSNYASIISRGIKSGKPTESEIYKVMIATGKDRMPPAPYPAIAKDKLDMIAKWIQEGGQNKVCGTTGNGATTAGTSRTVVVNFTAVNAILQTNCVSCHKAGFASAGISLDNYADIKKHSANGSLYGSITGASGYKKMPPGGQLTTCDVMIIKKWIDLGMPNN